MITPVHGSSIIGSPKSSSSTSNTNNNNNTTNSLSKSNLSCWNDGSLFLKYVLVLIVFTMLNWNYSVTKQNSSSIYSIIENKPCTSTSMDHNNNNSNDDDDAELRNELVTTDPIQNDQKTIRTETQNEVEKVDNNYQSETILSWDPLNSNWNNVEYYSGIIGNDPKFDQMIEKQCRDQAAVYGKANQCVGPINDRTTCCYCYQEYPMFLYEQQQQWQTHIDTIGTMLQPQDIPKRYWFCAKERETIFDKNYQYIPHKDVTIHIVTGKWGPKDRFREEVKRHCFNIQKIYDNTTIPNIKIFCYFSTPNYLLHDVRFERHFQYRINDTDDSSKGGGYWIHKTSIIKYHMDQTAIDTIDDDDDNNNNNNNNNNKRTYIVWIDNDRIDFLRSGTFAHILQTMILRNSDMAIETMDTNEIHWTKDDMIHAFNLSLRDLYSDQVNGNAWIVKNSIGMRQYIQAHIDCASDYHMISDEPSILERNMTKYAQHINRTTTASTTTKSLMMKPNEQNSVFIDHRHDQSIMSLMMKTYLLKQGLIGPPARNYQPPYTSYNTYVLPTTINTNNTKEDNIIAWNRIQCPFANFYKSYFLRKGNVRTRRREKT